MTLPGLIQDRNEKETVVRLKKAYNIFSNAYSLAILENNNPAKWDISPYNNITGAKKVMDKFYPYLKITKRCDGTRGCFYKNGYKLSNKK